MEPKGRLRWALTILLALIGLNALVASIGFIADPTGEGIGIPQDWLDDSPFDDYLVPGILLGGLGVLHGVAAVREWTGSRHAWLWAGLAASGLLVWIVVQAIMMGSFRHPIQTTLQATCLAIGVATGLLALAQLRRQSGMGVNHANAGFGRQVETRLGRGVLVRRRKGEPERLRLVLLAHDLSYGMRNAEAVTTRLAKDMGAKVHVVVVGSPGTRTGAAETDVMFGHAAPKAESGAAELRRRFQALGIPVHVQVERGSVAQALLNVERRLSPDVTVFGHAGRAQLEFPGYGTVIDQVKNEVASSVLVVHGEPFDAVAVGVDGSAPSLEAAATASGWAKALGLPLTLLLDPEARRPKVAGDIVPVEGPAGQFLLNWSKAHPRGLLVVGARGMGNPGLLRMGTVSDQLTWGAGSSVLVVRPRGTRE